MLEQISLSKKIGRMHFVYFLKYRIFGFYKTNVKGGTWFIDIWKFRIWRDGRVS